MGGSIPHFLIGSPTQYLYAAPVGLVPCPTFALTAGFALLLLDDSARAPRLLVSAVSAFYAVFGVLRLGVVLDIGLLVAAIALARKTQRHTQCTRVPYGVGDGDPRGRDFRPRTDKALPHGRGRGRGAARRRPRAVRAASSWCCSVHRAAANRRCSTSSAGSTRRRRARRATAATS